MLKTVGDNQSDDLEDDGNSELGDDVDFRSVTKYPSIADVIVEWTKKEPLSVVIANKGEKQGIYCCFSYGQKTSVVEFFWDETADFKHHYGMFYFPIKCSTQEATEIGEFVSLKELEVVSYGLLLPLLLRENMELEYDNSLYTLITSH